MDLKQSPFSLYDFIGYLTPGAIFLYMFMAIYAHFRLGTSVSEFIPAKLSFDKPEMYIPFILLAYTIGHILSFLSSITVERYSIWAFGYPSKYLLGLKHNGYYQVTDSVGLRIAIRTLVGLLLAPISLMDILLGAELGLRDLYAKKLDSLLIQILKGKIDSLIIDHAGIDDPNEVATPSEGDFFRYVYHYALENAPHHSQKMQNYVALYGFLRTLCFLSVVVFWDILYQSLTSDSFTVLQSSLLLLLNTAISYILYMAFVKFYRRFSLEALMAFAVIYEP